MDRGILKDRDLTEDEMVARAITDIISANKLGCTVMREQYLLSPSGLARIAPIAEAYNVHVGIEIHNPESPITQAIQLKNSSRNVHSFVMMMFQWKKQ